KVEVGEDVGARRYGDGFDIGQGGDSLPQLANQLSFFGLGHFHRHIQVCGEDVLRIEAQLYALQPKKTADEQPCADEQDDGQRNLRHDKQVAHAPCLCAFRTALRVFQELAGLRL